MGNKTNKVFSSGKKTETRFMNKRQGVNYRNDTLDKLGRVARRLDFRRERRP